MNFVSLDLADDQTVIATTESCHQQLDAINSHHQDLWTQINLQIVSTLTLIQKRLGFLWSTYWIHNENLWLNFQAMSFAPIWFQ